MQASKSEIVGTFADWILRMARLQANAFRALDPATGERLQPDFLSATVEEVEAGRPSWRQRPLTSIDRTSGRERGAFLRKIAANIEAIAAEVDRARARRRLCRRRGCNRKPRAPADSFDCLRRWQKKDRG